MFCNKCSFLVLCLILLTGFKIVRSQDFGYDGLMGPEHWGEQYNACDGKYQSPINIDESKVEKRKFPPINFNGFDITPENADLNNNGHTVVVTLNFEEAPTISGGPLNGTYKFSQFHFHWGENDTFGSEDTINNQSFPVELHMVFYQDIYKDFKDAISHHNGLTVLAFFYNISTLENPDYEEFSSLLERITEPAEHVTFINPPSMFDLISSDLEQYYTYFGSLTTPPCSESVQWMDFSVPIPISHHQIQSFRSLNGHHGPILHNFRPIQPINGRIVYKNIAEEDTPALDDDLDKKPDKDEDIFDDINKIDSKTDFSDDETVPDAVGTAIEVAKHHKKTVPKNSAGTLISQLILAPLLLLL